jgi:type I restriction enzyme S subunit
LFNNTNSTELVGKTGLFAGYSEPVVFSNHFTRIRTRTDTLSPDYLALWLRRQWLDGLFARICDRWIGQSAVQRNKLFALEIQLPPLAEQRRIAARSQEKLDAAAQARAAVQAQLSTMQALLAACLRAVFASPMARQWPRRRLGDVLKLRNQVVHPRDHPNGTAVFVGLEHIESLTGRRTGSVAVEMSELTGRKPRFYTGDIVYGYLRPYLNKVWVAEFPGLCSVDQYVYQVDAVQADTDFVAWFMRSPVYLQQAPIDASPGQLPRIRTEEVAAVEINLPSLQEQKALVACIRRELLEIARLREATSTRLTTLSWMPAALLREAFAGRI